MVGRLVDGGTPQPSQTPSLPHSRIAQPRSPDAKTPRPCDCGRKSQNFTFTKKNPGLPRPEKELKGFKKVFLKAGETQTVSIPLNRGAFAFYDPAKKGWVAEKDSFEILIGSSSRDIRLRDNFNPAQALAFK